MSIASLAAALLERPGFRARLNALIIDSVASQFSVVERAPSISDSRHDWNYLLQCASLLAQVETADCEDAALRIAQHCLSQNPPENVADAACVILDMLSNKPAIRLAESRHLVKPDTLFRLPLPLRAEWYRREIEHMAVVGEGRELALNRFQKAVWKATNRNQFISITAPTSTGKSFLLCQWLTEYFMEFPRAFVVYIVPTRALIHQVENDLRLEFEKDKGTLPAINISSLPIPGSVKEDSANMLVLTQERFHILMVSLQAKRQPSLLIVDEAHKLGDGSRGILLSHVIDSILYEASETKVIFASPMVSNPEILLRGRPTSMGSQTIASSHITVNQNLLWASQVPRLPTHWKLEACIDNQMVEFGRFNLPFRPSPSGKRLPLVASALADPSGGNLVYINGAADAEKAAHQLWDLQPVSSSPETELHALIDLVRRYIHPKYELAVVLTRGVAFHYGNMPLLIRTEIERLFKSGHIRFLVCTSTLVEGVNLPCKSIFVRGPQKGRGKPMNETDFWNLAGRAGRLGKEFQGNIVCVDPRIPSVWRTPPPTKRSTYPIKPATDKVFADFDSLIAYIYDDSQVPPGSSKQELDQLISYLMTQYVGFGTLQNSPGCMAINKDQQEVLESAIASMVKDLTLPFEVLSRNPGVNPYSMQRLQKYFQKRTKPVEELLPSLPESEDAVLIFNNIFCRINAHLAPVFMPPNRTFGLAIVVVNWMRGYTLNRLIGAQIAHYEKNKKEYKLANVIRDVMEDVEQIARFIAPRYVSCYIDILRYHLTTLNRQDLLEQLPDVNVWLEFGASQPTQLSLMGLGLSRTSAIAISEYIVDDNLDEASALDRITSLSIESLDLPLAVQREIRQLINSRGLGQASDVK